MTTSNLVRFATLALALLLLCGPTGTAFGQSDDRSFGWYAELISVDQASGSVTVRAPFLDHVANYVDHFSAGDKVVVVWTQFEGEADAVLYVESPEVMQVPGGYIVYADFVDADLAGHTMTFTVPQVNAAVSSLASAQPGTPIRLESPIKQPESVTPISSVALNARPAPRPKSVVEEEIVADPDGPLAQIAGDWKIEADVFGNVLELGCALLQSETELSGTCQGPTPEPVPVTGSVEGNTVRFMLTASLVASSLELTYSGAVDEPGTRMEGTIDFSGMAATFTGSKQEG